MGQMAVLGALYRNGEQSVGELAAHERVRPPSMTRTVNFLAEGGYVDRRAHASDGRQVVITLTDEGRAVLLADRARRDEWLARRLAGLSADERGALRRATPILQQLAQSD
jgi:DNA-binding MarR family transcriptional regulator